MPRLTCLWRIIKRSFEKNRKADDRAENCPEQFSWKLIRYMWTFEYRVKKRLAFLREKYPHVRFIKITNTKALNAFFRGEHMNLKQRSYTHLVGWIIFFQTVPMLLSRMHRTSVSNWYLTIKRSSLTPPSIVFPIVWPLLYLSIAYVGWRLWSEPRTQSSAFLQMLFVTQTVGNFVWSPLFFGAHRPDLSLIALLITVSATVALVVTFINKNISYGYVLLPYASWLLFATYLNTYIWLYN